MHIFVYCLLQDHIADRILSSFTLLEVWTVGKVSEEFEDIVSNYLRRLRAFDTHRVGSSAHREVIGFRSRAVVL